MEEKDLTPKQREWLEVSRRIGRGAMTKSERLLLERIYTEMLPAEQQELSRYIEEKFRKQHDLPPEEKTTPGPKVETQSGPKPEDITEIMEKKSWAPPSKKLLSALAKVQKGKSPDGK